METKEDIEETIRAYPNKLNKYIHQEARNKLSNLKEEKIDIKFNKVDIKDTDEYKDLKSKTVKELKLIARSKSIVKYYDMNEDELIKSILSVK